MDARIDVTTAIGLDGSDTVEEPQVVVGDGDGPAAAPNPDEPAEAPDTDDSVDRQLAATGGGATTALLGLGAAALAVAIRRRR